MSTKDCVAMIAPGNLFKSVAVKVGKKERRSLFQQIGAINLNCCRWLLPIPYLSPGFTRIHSCKQVSHGFKGNKASPSLIESDTSVCYPPKP